MFLNPNLIRLGWVAMVLFAVGGPASAQAADSPFSAHTVMSAPAQPTKMPEFEFANLHGGTLKSADMKGKVIVIRFWATW